MVRNYFNLILLTFLGIILLTTPCYGKPDTDESHIMVSMRMIGHKILLNSGDSTSQVLPIQKDLNRYKIQFESDFQFNPGQLVLTIDSVMTKSRIAKRYIVEVQNCETGEIIYSYEKANSGKLDMIPCASRMPTKDCYQILISIVEADNSAPLQGSFFGDNKSTYFIIILSVTSLFFAGLYLNSLKRKKKINTTPVNRHLLSIGDYFFDTLNSVLLVENEKVPLSGKEADLLLLLYNAANTTVDRQLILKDIWGDDNNYIGRTLDVFISKLRKKLEGDSSLKIVNVRGVGYKLVMNSQS
ncbi:MAG: winged helix-turn-helix domain-containing protein [Ginsengibacter sp.]